METMISQTWKYKIKSRSKESIRDVRNRTSTLVFVLLPAALAKVHFSSRFLHLHLHLESLPGNVSLCSSLLEKSFTSCAWNVPSCFPRQMFLRKFLAKIETTRIENHKAAELYRTRIRIERGSRLWNGSLQFECPLWRQPSPCECCSCGSRSVMPRANCWTIFASRRQGGARRASSINKPPTGDIQIRSGTRLRHRNRQMPEPAVANSVPLLRWSAKCLRIKHIVGSNML